MRVKRNDSPGMRLSQVNVGECFIYCNKVWIKTISGSDASGKVNLETGEYYIADGTKCVVPVDAEVVLK